MTAIAATDVLLARAYLSRVGEPGNVGLWLFVREVGPVAAMAALRAERASSRLLAETAARRAAADPEADLASADRHGLRLVVPESDEWPHFAFAALQAATAPLARAYRKGDYVRKESGEPVPPLALWVRGPGDLTAAAVRSVGIVGARAASPYGEHVTADFAFGLARREVVVVSGGAYGIDAVAHRAALAADGATILVSAGGLDRAYPTGNAALYERVAETGLLVSESPPGCAPQRRRFLTRNRLIAALSTGVVVVEAAARSGALNTAMHARTLGRPVLAVPGPVTSAMSVGCHDLLRREDDAAVLVTCVDDVLAVVGGAGEGLVERAKPTDFVRSELDGLSPTARAVFDGLHALRFSRPDEIAVRCGVTALEVIRTLPALDAAGLLETSDAGYRVAARVRAATGKR
ncbi:MAG TPA: DNA-processing protein DprA [Jatrophihabitantaceae bacterium]